MDLIKRTPDETHSPLITEWMGIIYQENAAAPFYSTQDPMIPWGTLDTLLQMVVKEVSSLPKLSEKEAKTRFLSIARSQMAIEYGKEATRTITQEKKEAMHKIIGGAHYFSGYDLPDPDDNYRGPHGAA
jgi:hypothetical protein